MNSELLRKSVRYGYLPFMVLGLNGAAYYVVTHGHSYAWLILLIGLLLGTAFAAEQILPWYDEWNHSHDDETTNIFHAVVYELQNVNGILTIPLIAWLIPNTLNMGIWPIGWPVWAQLILAVVLADFAFTIIHWLSHRYAFLWRLHAVHHGVARLYGLNGLVRHPLHQILDMVLGTAPLVIAGMPVQVALLLGFVVTVQLVVQHSNVAYALGPLRNHLAIGQIHHLHHVNWGKEGDCNFGLFFTFWDRMLGTFHAEPPRPIQAHDMGIDEVPNFPKNYVDHLVFPIRYKPGQGVQDLESRPRAKPRPQPQQTAAARARAFHDAAE